jgi:hypothetical protein
LDLIINDGSKLRDAHVLVPSALPRLVWLVSKGQACLLESQIPPALTSAKMALCFDC